MNPIPSPFPSKKKGLTMSRRSSILYLNMLFSSSSVAIRSFSMADSFPLPFTEEWLRSMIRKHERILYFLNLSAINVHII